MIVALGGASVQGQSHVKNNTPCQDANLFEQMDNATILVVADGLGSSCQSDTGSQQAIDAAKRYCQQAKFFSMKKLFKYSRASVLRYAQKNQIGVDDLHTTLLCAVIKANQLHVGQIGDGAIVLKSSSSYERCFQAFYQDNKGPLNITSTLLQDNYQNELNHQVVELTDIDEIYLMTDGVTPVSICHQDESVFTEFFDYFNGHIIKPEMSSELASKRITSLLNSGRFGQHSTDDKSLVYAIYRSVRENE